MISPDQINEIVTHLLLSDDARAAFKTELRRRAHRITHEMTTLIENHTAGTPCNVICLLERVHQSFTNQNKLLCDFNPDLRVSIAATVVKHISHTINICQWQWIKNIKPVEVRMYIVGLMYLMRSGVNVHNVQVIPCIPLLTYLLPTENLLETMFQYKSKHITDIDNKFKFFFRQMPHETLQKMAFHARA
jgi:hypothetical protein